jgi:hypothetical protein
VTRLLVCGGRDYDDEAHAFDVLNRLHAQKQFTCVIHGACRWDADLEEHQQRKMSGADALADRWALSLGLKLYRVPAAWKRLGPQAGPIRNSGMLAYQPDIVVAFPGDRGTNDMIKKARKAKVTVLTIMPASPTGGAE